MSNKTSIFSKSMALSLFSLGLISYAQIVKIDPRFDELIKSKNQKGLVSIFKGTSLELSEKQIKVTGKGAEELYSAIIYSKNVENLKNKGILVQSELPTFATALLTLSDIEKLAQDDEIISVEAPRIRKPFNEVNVFNSGAGLLHSGVLNNTSYTGKGVLVGVIDTGINWKHPDFKDPNNPTKSRILRIWDQTLTTQTGENVPTGFDYGVEYTQEMINDEIDGTPTGKVRQEDVHGHGTHVAATAAGNGSALQSKKYKGMAPESELIIVKAGNSGFSDNNIINGLRYMQKMSEQFGKPIVVNMSLGGHNSPHDGTDANDVAVDVFSHSGKGRVAVIAAGNEHGDKIHSSFDISANGTGQMSFNLPSSTSVVSTNTLLNYFVLSADNNNQVELEFTTPDGQTHSFTTSGQVEMKTAMNGLIRILVLNRTLPSNNKRNIIFVVQRAASIAGDIQGNYQVRVVNKDATAMKFHIWKASEHATIATTLNNADDTHTVGSPGTATTALTVGAYTGQISYYSEPMGALRALASTGLEQEKIAIFSSEGPRVDGVMKPEITASGFYVGSARNNQTESATRLDLDTDLYYTISQGTSMASPAVAGAVALLLQANPDLNYDKVKERITSTANKDAATTSVANNRWGHGKLNIYKAVAQELGKNLDFESIAYDRNFDIFSQEATANIPVNQTKLGVRYTPTKTGKLGAVSFYTSTRLGQNDQPIIIEIRKKKEDNTPSDEIIAQKEIPSKYLTKYSWNSVDLTDLNVKITKDEDFFVIINRNDVDMSFRVDRNADNRTYVFEADNIRWRTATLDLKMRALVYEDNQTQASTTEVPLTNKSGLKIYNIRNGKTLHIALQKAKQVILYDMVGRVLGSWVVDSKQDLNRIDLSAFASGAYVVQVVLESGEKITQKIKKENNQY